MSDTLSPDLGPDPVAPAADEAAAPVYRWILLGVVSFIFFVNTGAVWSSLGVMLPSMINELAWSWPQAGLGFTIIGLLTGVTSTVPAYTIKRFKSAGARVALVSGCLIGAVGFALIATTNSIAQFYIGAGLIGAGYSQAGIVTAVKAINEWFDTRQGLAIGVFFTSGAVGSIVGPVAASTVLASTDSWRPYWWGLAVVLAALGAVAAFTVHSRNSGSEDADAQAESDASAASDWTLAEAMRTPQFYIISLGVTITLLGAITMNTWQVTHMVNLGVSTQVAAGALSAHAVFNALARAFGGAVSDRISAKWLFISGLAAGVIGMFALSHANGPILIAAYAIGDGYGFGIVIFASTMLLLNYFGSAHNPAILGTLNLITTAAMAGPVIAGVIGSAVGGFTYVFAGIGVMLALTFFAALPMKKPVRRTQPQSEAA